MNSSSVEREEQGLAAENGRKGGSSPLDRPVRISWGWGLIGLLILIQWLLFRQYAEREIVWGYPAYFDQAVYLAQCHEIYEVIIQDGFWRGIGHFVRMDLPNGRSLPLQGALMFLLFGASRLSALALNFLYFAGFLAVLAYTLHWLTGRWAIAFTGIGLALASGTRFFWAGGYMDFRLDFINACNYGILLCLVIRSEMFRSRGWSLVVGVQIALTLWLRLLMAPILVGVFGLLGVLFLYRSRAQLRNLLAAAALALVLLLPCLVPSLRQSLQYYVGEAVSGAPAARADEQQIRNVTEWALYYVRSIAVDHLGRTFISLGAILIIVSLLVLAVSRGGIRDAHIRLGGQFERTETLMFLGASFLVPLLVLTIYPVRSPVVANILAPPAFGLVLLPVVIVVGLSSAVFRSALIVNAWIVTATGASLLLGLHNELGNLSRPGPHREYEEDTRKIVAFVDTFVTHCKRTGLKRPFVALDRITDYLNGGTIRALAYERHGYILRPQYSMPQGMFPVSESQAIENIANADLAIVRDTDAPLVLGYDYPFNVEMRKHQERLRSAAAEHLERIATVQAFGEAIGLYIRPTARLAGESGRWITSKGVDIISSTEALKRRPLILLSGRTMRVGDFHESIDVFAELSDPPGREGTVAPARFRVQRVTPFHVDYEILIDTSGLSLPPSPDVKIHLRFNNYFVPRQVSGSNDDRELVIETPERIQLLTSKEEVGSLPSSQR
jgi:hypothetical protein